MSLVPDDPVTLAARIAVRAGLDRPLVALDNDGTLAPIAPRPELARLAPGAEAAIRTLDEMADVVIISGRGLEDLVDRFGDLPVALVSEHGLRHRVGDGAVRPLCEPLPAAVLDELRARLAALVPSDPTAGWLVEDKGLTIAVHHRLVPDDRLEPTRSLIEAVLQGAAADGGGHVQSGKAVLELRPAGASKGAALRHLHADRGGACVVMVGDDATDESALAFAESAGGVGVLVAEAPRPSAASARLADPGAVVMLLEALPPALRQGR